MGTARRACGASGASLLVQLVGDTLGARFILPTSSRDGERRAACASDSRWRGAIQGRWCVPPCAVCRHYTLPITSRGACVAAGATTACSRRGVVGEGTPLRRAATTAAVCAALPTAVAVLHTHTPLHATCY